MNKHIKIHGEAHKLGFVVYSYPRSGRGITMQMMRAQKLTCITGDARPPQGQWFFFTHDFKGTESYESRHKIVLRGDPLESMCSWFEMDVANGGRKMILEHWRMAVCGEWTSYWKTFARRHLLDKTAQIINFDELCYKQHLVVPLLCSQAGVGFDKTKFIEPYPRRDATQFEFYSEDEWVNIRSKLEPEYSEVKGSGW